MPPFSFSPAAKVAAFYCLFGTAWIIGSDTVVEALFGENLPRLGGMQTAKGLFFIGVMTTALYFLVARLHRAEEQNRRIEAMLRVSKRLEAVGGLAATLVHDFNNMLGVIRGFTDLARYEQGKGDNVPPERLADIDAAVTRANAMVRQLSQFLHRRPGAAASQDVGVVVQEFEPLLRQAATSRIDFTLDVEPDLPPVMLDRAAIEQAVLNLVVNARDALRHAARQDTPKAPPRPQSIRVAVQRRRLRRHTAMHQPRPQTGDFVCISVADTGCGIDPEHLVSIFHPFFTTKPAGEGMGLGLSSVLHTAQQHQGWVEVDSQPGRGARFDLYLPVPAAESPPVPVAGDRRGSASVATQG
jgi:two-component system, cell cycle sensor histidine kinase and response regulator CckA